MSINTSDITSITNNPQPNQIGANFILDSGSIKHVITNREYFISYKDFRTRISWGTNASIEHQISKQRQQNCTRKLPTYT
jgi:hypothetical protein